jgi:hypothetical protein
MTVARVGDMRVMLWSCDGQCDWWISACSETSLTEFTSGLLEMADLRRALWSTDEASTRLLNELC